VGVRGLGGLELVCLMPDPPATVLFRSKKE